MLKKTHRSSSRLIGLLVASLLPGAAQAVSWENVTFNGYFNFEYEKTLSGDPEEDTNGSFDLDLVDLVFNVQATDRLRVAMDFTYEHGTATEDGRGNSAIEYAFAEYTINPLFKVKVGKMFTHFGIYNEIHTAKPANLTVKEPLSTNKNNKFGSEVRFYPRWLSGVALQGNGDFSDMEFDYDLQLSNGETEDEGANPYEEDDNTSKALNGRIRLNPSDDLRVGFSFYSDSMEDPSSATDRIDINSYGLQFEWDSGTDFAVELEYVWGSEDWSTIGSIDRAGYSAMVYYNLDQFTPYLRHEHIDPDDSVDNDEGTRTALGVNWRIAANTHLKFEVDKIETDPLNGKFGGADWTEFKASVSIGF
jgi:hypothetical protein